MTQLSLVVLLALGALVAAVPWSQRPTSAGNTIAAGEQWELDVDLVSTQPLIVQGQLTCTDKDLKISVPRISIVGNGKFICGTANQRYTKKLTITMTGPRIDDGSIFHSKCIAVTGDGVLQLHGENRVRTWTQLGATAEKDATTITLAEDVDWRVGEKIVIASTDFDMNQAETRTITKVEGRTLTLDNKLNFMHWGTLQKFNSGKMTLDERAEVALISRNILFKGDDENAKTRHGAHIIITGNGQGYIDGVELTNVGLGRTLGRYPIHWHLRRNAQGQYARKNSIHHTFNRCLTVHGTDSLMISDNLCMESTGHGYFIEDGFEQNNQFIHNIGLLTRQQPVATALLPTDHTTVSTFWITNPNNVFRRNAAAGSDHAGFWFALPLQPLAEGADLKNIKPQRTNIKVFDDNRAHSSPHANLAIDGQPNAAGELAGGHYNPRIAPLDPGSAKAIPIIRRFTGFKCIIRSVWIRANTLKFEDCVHADNGLSTMLAFNQFQTRSLFVGISANIGNPSSPLELAAEMSLPHKAARSLESPQFKGHAIYDGPTFTLDSHFANFNKRWAKAFQGIGAAVKSPLHVTRGISFENTPVYNRVDFATHGARGTIVSSGIIDMDGSIAGKAGVTIQGRPAQIPINAWPASPCFTSVPDACQDRPAWNAAVCEGVRYAHMFVANGYPIDNSDNDNMGVTRSDGLTTQFFSRYGTFGGEQFQVIVNKGFSYRLTYGRIPANLLLRFTFALPGESIIMELPNWPTLGFVDGATKVNTVAELKASGGSSYLQHNNNVLVRMVAKGTTSGYENEAGAVHYPARTNVRLCVKADCSKSPLRYAARLADFETGVDVHATVAAQAPLKISPLLYAWTMPFNSQEEKDDINYYDITSDGAGVRKYGDFRFTFAAQNWLVYRSLQISLSGGCVMSPDCNGGAEYEVHLHDRDQKYMLLGKGKGVFEIALPQERPTFLDAVDGIVIRLYNDQFMKDLSKTGKFRTHLNSLTLTHFSDASAAYVRPAGATYPKELSCASSSKQFAPVPATPPPAELPKPIGLPFGHIDGVDSKVMRGWVCDEDAGTAPVFLHIYATPDGEERQFYKQIQGDQPRADVTKVYPTECPGGNHGFVYYFPNTAKEQAWGTKPVLFQIFAIGVAKDGSRDGVNPLLGSKTTVVKPLANPPKVTPAPPPPPPPKAPRGHVDVLNEKLISGWVCDGDTPAQSIKVRVYFGTVLAFETVANRERPDLTVVPDCKGSTKHGFQIEWKGGIVLPKYETNPVEVKVFGVNTGAPLDNPQIGAKTLKIVRQDKPKEEEICTKGSAGCACGTDDACDNGLQCSNAKCVMAETCAKGSLGCPCDSNKCSDLNSECVEDRCVRQTCPKGRRGCPCDVTSGADLGLYPCANMNDECVMQLDGYVCLPKSSAGCEGEMGCFCRKDGEVCDAGLECGLDGRCGQPECPAGTKGCACDGPGYCSEGLQCITSQCVVPKCDGQLACKCREGGLDSAPTAVAGDDIEVGEAVVLACDEGLQCLRAKDDSGAFCIYSQAVTMGGNPGVDPVDNPPAAGATTAAGSDQETDAELTGASTLAISSLALLFAVALV